MGESFQAPKQCVVCTYLLSGMRDIRILYKVNFFRIMIVDLKPQ